MDTALWVTFGGAAGAGFTALATWLKGRSKHSNGNGSVKLCPAHGEILQRLAYGENEFKEIKESLKEQGRTISGISQAVARIEGALGVKE